MNMALAVIQIYLLFNLRILFCDLISEELSATPSLPNTSSDPKLNVKATIKPQSRNHFVRHSISSPSEVRTPDERHDNNNILLPIENSNFLSVSNSATPLIQPKKHNKQEDSPNGRRKEHLDWILVDPEKEFEAILSKISDQRGTFV